MAKVYVGSGKSSRSMLRLKVATIAGTACALIVVLGIALYMVKAHNATTNKQVNDSGSSEKPLGDAGMHSVDIPNNGIAPAVGGGIKVK